MKKIHISSTSLVRSIGDILGRVRFRGEAFIIERSGKPVAVLSPYPATEATSLAGTIGTWVDAGPPDLEWANVIENVGTDDQPPEDRWESS